MIIGIDGYFMVGKRTGMGVMLENILCRWPSEKFEKTVLFVPRGLSNDKTGQIKKQGIDIREIPNRNFIVWEQISLPQYARKASIDCLWFPYNTASIFWKGKTIVTIHDLIYMHGNAFKQPSLYNAAGALYRRFVVPIAASKADKILMSSTTSKELLIQRFKGITSKVAVVYCSCEENENELNEKDWGILKSTNHLEQYILAFGSTAPRKNTMRNIQAFQKIIKKNPDFNYKLVLFGFRNWEKSEVFTYVKDHNLLDRIVFLEYITETEKNSLYANAELFLFTSTEEGFGIPILEAFKMKTNVITSNTTSMPEIAGNAALLVDPFSINEISNAIETMLSMDVNERNKLIKLGRERYQMFSWHNVVSATIEAILRK